MHVSKENNNEENTTNYHLHTMQTVYDISYYTNLIDIHIDNPLVITMNPFQVNSLLQLLNSILDQPSSSLTTKQSIDSLPIDSVTVTLPNETPSNETPSNETPPDKNTKQPSKPIYPVTSKFNVNAISLWLESFTFNYYMPLTLLPSSYQQHFSYTGEEKEQQSSSFPSLSSFALPYDFSFSYDSSKSLLKSVFSFSFHGLELVMNIYDNQFYNTDILCILHDVKSFFNHL